MATDFDVTVNKDELLTILRENRERHHDIFLEALEGFRTAVTKRLEEMVENAKSGKKYELQVNLVRPDDHTKEYDQIISMLEMEISDTVTLDWYQFQNWVRDDWGWKEQFLTTNSYYSMTAAASL